jgi:hypoxanthine phosphoribosyltransferase
MEQELVLNGISFQPYLPKVEIDAAISRMAAEIIDANAGNQLDLLCVLKGAFFFTADLSRLLPQNTRLHFVRVSSYGAEMQSSGKVKMEGSLAELKEKKVLICEDIVETGLSIDYLYQALLETGVAEIQIAALFFKPGKWKGIHQPDFVGIELKDEFVVGCGLDLDQQGRCLPDLWIRK